MKSSKTAIAVGVLITLWNLVMGLWLAYYSVRFEGDRELLAICASGAAYITAGATGMYVILRMRGQLR